MIDIKEGCGEGTGKERVSAAQERAYARLRALYKMRLEADRDRIAKVKRAMIRG